MNRNMRHILFIAYIIGIIIAGLVVNARPWELSPIWVLGLATVLFWLMFEIIGPIGRGLTSQLIGNIGHESIRPEDLHHIPWGRKTKYKDTDETDVHNILMTYAFTGGMDVDKWWLTAPGKKEDAVWIFPSMFEEKLQNNYVCYATLFKRRLSQLPPSIKETLETHYHGRVGENTPIYFGLTSPLNRTSTEKNISLEDQLSQANQELDVMKDRLVRAYEEMRRGKEVRDNKYILGEKLKKVEDDD